MATPIVDVLDSGLTESEIAALLEYFYENRQYEADVHEQGREGYSFESLYYLARYVEGASALSKVDQRALPLLRVLDKCKNYFLEKYDMRWRLEYKRGFLNSMETGAFLPRHSDDNDIYAGKRSEEVHYSGLLFLTGPEEYEGGEISFSDQETDTLLGTMKPKAGELVLFKGNTMHEVKQVTSGSRVNFVIFFRDYNRDSGIVIDQEAQSEFKEMILKEIKDHPLKK